MSEAKHTPGDWQVLTRLSGSENHKGYRIVNSERDSWFIADVSPIDEDGIEGGANAKLIAAAPDLLEAAKKVSGSLNERHIYGLEELNAAIKKATS